MLLPLELTSLIPSGSVLLMCALIWLGWTVVWLNWKPTGLPPGPFSLPVIGSLLSMRGADKREELRRLALQYGDIFTLDLGIRRTVILASYDSIKEGLVNNAHALSGRPLDMFMFKEILGGRGIIGTEGHLWKQQRKFVHSVFREFGIGRPVFERKIQEEVTKFLLELYENLGKAYDPKDITEKAVSNVINSVTYGHRHEYSDPVFIRRVSDMDRTVRIIGNSGLLTIMPFLKYLPGDHFGSKRLQRDLSLIQGEIRESIEEHRENRIPGVTLNLIDAYLEEMEKQQDDPTSTFDVDQLITMIIEIFTAGTKPTSETLLWSLLYLLDNQEVLRRVQQEVETVVGSSRMPCMADKPAMPYTQAVLLEVQRMGDVVTLGLPHKTMQAVTLRGARGHYNIPAGMDVMTLMYAVHRDPKVWHEPYLFRPERFLDNQGQLCKDERMIPFSMGRRVCLGESLARMELFLFFVALMQHFVFVLPDDQPLPPLKGNVGLNHAPPHFHVIMERK